MTRPRVLMIAEECNPQWVSVPLVGWSIYRSLSSLVDAHLITQIRNRDGLIGAGLVEDRDFTVIDTEPLQRPVFKLAQTLGRAKGKGWTTHTALAALSYPYFEHLIWKRFGQRIASHQFDVVHRITPLTPTAPSLLAGKCRSAGVPFVLGPLNGGVPWPKGFGHARRREWEWLSYFRDAYKLLPGYRSTRRNASAILVASRDTLAQIPPRSHHKCIYLPENAIDPSRFIARRIRKASLPLRLIFVGRLVPYKGADMLIEAAAPLIKAGKLTLRIVGDGPQMPDLKQSAAKLEISPSITFPGWLPHEHVQHELADADLFAFPSIREFGGAVALEAMAVGLPPLVVRYGGLAELVTDQTGFFVEPGTRQQIVQRLAHTLSELTQHPERIDRKSPMALRRAHEQFTWQTKARQIVQVYHWLLGRGAQPDFPAPVPDPIENPRTDNPPALARHSVASACATG